MSHMLAGPNLGISTTRGTEIAGGWEHIFATSGLMQHHTVSNKEVNYLFPLYLYPPGDDALSLDVSGRSPNLAPGFVDAVAERTALQFVPDGQGNLISTFGPEDVLHYIYAILHSPDNRRRYADFLRFWFPRIPAPRDRALFVDLAGAGARLMSLHLMTSQGDDIPAFAIDGSGEVERIRYSEPSGDTPGRVWINRDQHFEGVSHQTWQFTIGGYQPAKKWLQDRKGRVLDFEDVQTYQRICAALAETPRVMQQIDDIIEAQGGWPLGASPTHASR